MESNYTKYDNMRSEELRELLRQDLRRPPEESDTEAVLYISRVLAERRAAAGRGPDVDKAWKSFRRDYLPRVGKGPTPKTPRSRKRAWRTPLIVVAAAVVLVVAAYGVGTRGWFARWTGDEFHYTEVQAEKISITEPEEPFETLEEALAYYGAPEDMVPAVLPDGYEYAGFDCSVTPGKYVSLTTWYKNGSDEIFLSYTLYADMDGARDLYKDESAPEVYTVNGIEHYIMTNVEEYQAVWERDNFECCIYGFENKAGLITAIDSMYDGE